MPSSRTFRPTSAARGLADLPLRKTELDVERLLGRMAARNAPASSMPFFVGAGAYKHHVPATVDHLIQRSEFLTSYTPYQPEIAQGTLQYLFEFQTQVAALTGMEVANASMYDGSTACGEAVLMAHRVTRRSKAVLSGGLHPHYAEVVRTLSRMASDDVVTLAPDVMATRGPAVARSTDTVSCVVVQTPDVFGNLRDLTADRREVPRRRRAADRRVHRGRLARPRQVARRDGRGHRGRRGPVHRQRRSTSAAPMSACSPPRRNMCARCPAASAARLSMPRASAASC